MQGFTLNTTGLSLQNWSGTQSGIGLNFGANIQDTTKKWYDLELPKITLDTTITGTTGTTETKSDSKIYGIEKKYLIIAAFVLFILLFKKGK